MNETLWKLSVATTVEAEEAVVELLAEVLQRQPSVYVDRSSGRPALRPTRSSSAISDFDQRLLTLLRSEATAGQASSPTIERVVVSVYLKQRLSKQERQRLRSGLERIQQCGLAVGSGRLSLTRLRPENWAEAWKRHFKPIELGTKLLVKPSWSRRRAKPGQATVVLDPGLSFGTGQHATTRFCLGELARLRNPRVDQAFLDVGTGSGILAIAAAKLGYKPVSALDYDPEAVAVARANARRNGADALIGFSRQDITKPERRAPRTYDLICANLIANVLLDSRAWLAKRLKSEGAIVVAGVLETEFGTIQGAYESLGLKIMARRVEKEWCSASFVGPKYAGIPKWPKKP